MRQSGDGLCADGHFSHVPDAHRGVTATRGDTAFRPGLKLHRIYALVVQRHRGWDASVGTTHTNINDVSVARVIHREYCSTVRRGIARAEFIPRGRAVRHDETRSGSPVIRRRRARVEESHDPVV